MAFDDHLCLIGFAMHATLAWSREIGATDRARRVRPPKQRTSMVQSASKSRLCNVTLTTSLCIQLILTSGVPFRTRDCGIGRG
jgi:hypothetical protein